MIFDIFFQLYEYLFERDWSRFLFWANIVSGLISIALIVFIGVIVKKLSFYNIPRFPKPKEKEEAAKIKITKEPWLAILKKLESDNSADWNVAVMQADSLVDKILQEMGLPGETMGDRMKTLDKSRFSSLDDLWEAHRIRNEIAHSPEKAVTKHRASYAISLFEKVLREMGYIE